MSEGLILQHALAGRWPAEVARDPKCIGTVEPLDAEMATTGQERT